jgi:acid stress-induced BolA-like protein IbaG/YrbA
MSLRVLNPSEQTRAQLRSAIEAVLPGAEVEVRSTLPGHFEIRVVAEAFRGQSTLEQHRLVYGAIASLMQGQGAPVHAVDQLETLTPASPG